MLFFKNFAIVTEHTINYNFIMRPLHIDRSKVYAVVGGIVFAIVMIVIGIVLILWAGKKREIQVVTPVVQITRIPAPTSTSMLTVPTASISTTAESTEATLPGMIGMGTYVQVAGTDGTGLRMRSDPGTSSEIRFVAMDAEVFLVIGGPVEKDDYTWWQLEAPYDKNRSGWSADAFLSLLEDTSDTP